VPTFDWRQLQRWGIDRATLPPQSEIRFRTPTTWESYRGYIIATVVVVVVQLLLIAGLLMQRAKRRHAEWTVRRREATLRASYERIRQLAGRLINAQEEARAHIARDLHDDVCQEMVGVSLAVSSLKRSSSSLQDAHTQQALATLEHRTLDVVEGIRRLSHDLHPATLRLLGLTAALTAHAIEVEKRYDVQVSFRGEGDFRYLHPDVAVCLFRIAQEAFRNGAVHGAARRFAVSLVKIGEDVELTVVDDGRGFDLDAVRRDGRGLGLVSMEERVYAVGGSVSILTRTGDGTTICVRVPAGVRETATRDSDGIHEHLIAHS
jgi:signal transduction histidine kinase